MARKQKTEETVVVRGALGRPLLIVDTKVLKAEQKQKKNHMREWLEYIEKLFGSKTMDRVDVAGRAHSFVECPLNSVCGRDMKRALRAASKAHAELRLYSSDIADTVLKAALDACAIAYLG